MANLIGGRQKRPVVKRAVGAGVLSVFVALMSTAAVADMQGGLGGLVSGIGGALGDNVVGGTVGVVGDAVSGVGGVLNGGNTSGTGGVGNSVGGAVGGSLGGVVGGVVNGVGGVLGGTGSSSGGGGNGGGGTGGTGGGGGNGGGTGDGNGPFVTNTAGTGSQGSTTTPMRGTNYATTCTPMGNTAFNGFSAVDGSRTPLGQVQGVELNGDKIVKVRFLTDSAIFGVRRCITVSGATISSAGSSLVLPISQTQLIRKIGG